MDLSPSLPSKRIEYIDALRGFTMVLVVFAHIETYGFDMYLSTIAGRMFSVFRMPTFFFISGFIAYKHRKWDVSTWFKMVKMKTRVQVIPTIVFGLIYTYLVCGTTLTTFFTHEAKLGYWFTLVLLEMYIILYSINLLTDALVKNKDKERICSSILLVSTAFILYLLKSPFLRIPSLHVWGDYFCLHKLFVYFMYFALGHIAAMYKNIFEKILNNQYITAAIIIIFSIILYVYLTFDDANMNHGISRFYRALQGPILGVTGSLIVYNYFRKYQHAFVKEKAIGGVLQTIGRRTLDIYLLHYFFIPFLPQVGQILSDENRTIVLELIIGISLALCIIVLCLVISNILRTSNLLEYCLFGVKKTTSTKTFHCRVKD